MPDHVLHHQHRTPEAEPPDYAALQLPDHLYRVGSELSLSEASALASRGALRAVAGLYSASGRPTAEDRAWAMASQLRPQTRQAVVVCRMSAAWIHGCAPEPLFIDAAAHRRRTLSLGAQEDIRVRRRFVDYSSREVQHLGPLCVTDPLRTCADLALHATDAGAETALYSMLHATCLRCPPETVVAVIRALPRVPHPEQAVALVQDLAEAGRDPVIR